MSTTGVTSADNVADNHHQHHHHHSANHGDGSNYDESRKKAWRDVQISHGAKVESIDGDKIIAAGAGAADGDVREEEEVLPTTITTVEAAEDKFNADHQHQQQQQHHHQSDDNVGGGLSTTNLVNSVASTVENSPRRSIDSSSRWNTNFEDYEDSTEPDGSVANSPVKNSKSRPKPPPITIMDSNQTSTDIKTPVTPGPSSGSDLKRKQTGDKERKIGHRRVDDEGQVTYKKIQTTQIMGSIQLGIGHAVGSLASKPERDLLMKDFMELETVLFNKDGTPTTPAHHYNDFRFKVYAPIAFRYFRDLFGIQPDDYLLSLVNEPLRELSNPGASGSVFYLTTDDNFIIKTVQHKEAEFLLKLLPGYYMNLNQNPRTLLPKFFGQYCYICGGKNVRFIVMNNLLPSYLRMHEKYDLKGSTYKRKANKYERKKDSPTYKDLDFMEMHPEGIYLEVETYSALIKTMQRDCRVLESFKIMDYSLLVGVHNLDEAAKEKEERQRAQASQFAELAAQELCSNESNNKSAGNNHTGEGAAGGACGLNRTKSLNKQRIAAYSTALESIHADIDPIDQEDDIPPGGIPARNSKGERLLLYIGIIDILQSYRFKKKLEHTFKSMLHDGDSISVHRPNFYAQRFLDFMSTTVFRKIPSLDLPEIKGTHRKFRTLVSSYIGLGAAVTTKAGKPAAGSGSSASAQSQQQQQQQSHAPFHHKPHQSPHQHQHPSMAFHHGRYDNTKYLRTAVIKQAAANKQSVIMADNSQNGENELSVTSSCASSLTSSGLGSTLRTITWTPPHSIGTVTPSHTEGTPSLTESSESEFAPTTPMRSRSSTRYSRSTLADDDNDAEVCSKPKGATMMMVASIKPPPMTKIVEDWPV